MRTMCFNKRESIALQQAYARGWTVAAVDRTQLLCDTPINHLAHNAEPWRR